MKFTSTTIAESWDEAADLIQANGEETGIPGLPARPNRAIYELMESTGKLAVFVVRADAGKLMGYALFTVAESPQYLGVKMAFQEVIYLAPECRGWWGGRFLLWTERQLKALGVHLVQRMSRDTRPHERSLERMGYQRHAVLYLKEV